MTFICRYSCHRKDLLAVCALVLMAGNALGAAVTFRNDTTIPIIVQGMSIINNKVRAGQRHVLLPGQTGSDAILVPGKKLILIADARQPTRTLHQETIVLTGLDVFISIQVPPPPAEEKTGPNPKPALPAPALRLVPIAPPKPSQVPESPRPRP